MRALSCCCLAKKYKIWICRLDTLILLAGALIFSYGGGLDSDAALRIVAVGKDGDLAE
jgi:hypothetical protein